MTSSAAVNPAPPETTQPQAVAESQPAFVRFAETEQDVTEIHQFLIAVAGPRLECKVNFLKSLREIMRVVREEAALMLIKDGVLVGTMGVINPCWWYGDDHFMCDRWHFTLPEVPHAEAELLEDEAIKLALAAGLKFYHQGKIRKGKKGIGRLMPRVYGAESAKVEGEGE